MVYRDVAGGIPGSLTLRKVAAKARSGSAAASEPRPLQPAFSGIHRELAVVLP